MLVVRSAASKSWVLRVTDGVRRRDIGSGSVKSLSLAEAREKSRFYRQQISRGIDPVAEARREKDVVPTFREAALRVHAEQKVGWKNGKHQLQWLSTLENYRHYVAVAPSGAAK